MKRHAQPADQRLAHRRSSRHMIRLDSVRRATSGASGR